MFTIVIFSEGGAASRPVRPSRLYPKLFRFAARAVNKCLRFKTTWDADSVSGRFTLCEDAALSF
ncbi:MULTISPECIES: hypothetical protein [Methylosinus]|uniref:hypothetical protein n=1 Tax=Methylosinus TaxID=425 RepID=UPI0012DEC1D1|nr:MULTISPECIES: hypothetical protein [Methylosinus]